MLAGIGGIAFKVADFAIFIANGASSGAFMTPNLSKLSRNRPAGSLGGIMAAYAVRHIHFESAAVRVATTANSTVLVCIAGVLCGVVLVIFSVIMTNFTHVIRAGLNKPVIMAGAGHVLVYNASSWAGDVDRRLD